MTDDVRLSWSGKRAPVVPDPTPLVNAAGGEQDDLQPNLLIAGDNLAAMAALQRPLAGKFALIYLDPPFFTGKEWRTRAVPPSGASREAAPPGPDLSAHTGGFSDCWEDLGSYLQWLLDRLAAAHRLLRADGCLYLHLSWHSVHYAKLLMDEVFGAANFQNEIVWCYREAINSRKRWNRKHDTILFYSKGQTFTFNCDTALAPYAPSTVRKFRHRDANGPYRLMGRGITGSHLRSKRDLPAEAEALFPQLTYRHYLGAGTLPVDYWQIDIENQASPHRTGYPTQKPVALLERILLASTNPGDLVGDFCCGSGTTLAVAEQLGRGWVGCDRGAQAVDTTRGRLNSLGAAFTTLRFRE